YLKEISTEFDITLETLSDELQKYLMKQKRRKDTRREQSRPNKTVNYPGKRMLPAFQNAERILLGHMLTDETVAEKVQGEIGARFNVESHQIIATHLYAFYESGHEPEVSLFIEQLNDPEIKNLVIEIAMQPLLEEVSDTAIHDYIQTIQSQQNQMDSIQALTEKIG